MHSHNIYKHTTHSISNLLYATMSRPHQQKNVSLQLSKPPRSECPSAFPLFRFPEAESALLDNRMRALMRILGGQPLDSFQSVVREWINLITFTSKFLFIRPWFVLLLVLPQQSPHTDIPRGSCGFVVGGRGGAAASIASGDRAPEAASDSSGY